ncbi:MAG: hydrogenase formation protein HypD, partial [Eubacteriales bacterium]
KYFEPDKAYWRGLDVINESGYYLKSEFERFDAGSKNIIDDSNSIFAKNCRCGEVITGKINPNQCPLFRKVCSPSNPQGPCMVSSEGTCGIWYRFSK